jgi:predicted nuclease of predicted toxin-antitoxin system
VRVLLDACLWGGALEDLKSARHDVLWAGDWDQDPGDEEILAKAHNERRVPVTLDKDFGELAVVKRVPHSGILRRVNFPARQQGLIALQTLTHYGEDLRSGAIITVDARRIRIRPALKDE